MGGLLRFGRKQRFRFQKSDKGRQQRDGRDERDTDSNSNQAAELDQRRHIRRHQHTEAHRNGNEVEKQRPARLPDKAAISAWGSSPLLRPISLIASSAWIAKSMERPMAIAANIDVPTPSGIPANPMTA